MDEDEHEEHRKDINNQMQETIGARRNCAAWTLQHTGRTTRATKSTRNCSG